MKKNVLLTLAIMLLGTINLFGMNDDPSYYNWNAGAEKPDQAQSPGGKEKEKFSWEEEKKLLHDSAVFHDPSFSEFVISIMLNQADESTILELLDSAIHERSLPTQFDCIEDCIHTAITLVRVDLANRLYEKLVDHYKKYFQEDPMANIYRQRCLHLTQENPPLTSVKLPLPNVEKKFTRVDGIKFANKKYFFTEVQSPRQKKAEKVHKKSLEDYDLTYHSEVLLQASSSLVAMKGHYLLAAKQNGEIDCYRTKRDTLGTWRKTLGFPDHPVLFCPFTGGLETESLMITPLQKIKIGIISSQSMPPPLCAFFTADNEEIPSYILEGTHKGALIKHDVPNDQSAGTPEISKQNKIEFSEQHNGAITALLALKKCAYSAARDRSLKKWNMVTGTCENHIEELEDVIQGLAYIQDHLIGLLGQKLVLFNLDIKPPRTLSLCTFPQEKGELWTSLTSFNNKLLLGGTNKGQLKLCNPRDGFNKMGNVDISRHPIKSVVNVEDKYVLVHHHEGDKQNVIILSKAKKD
jgi:hypothetical protein